MIDFARLLRRQRLSLIIGTSTLAWNLAMPSTAQAQCAPDPTVANGITTCTGTDDDGLTVATQGTQVVVESDATVRPGAAAAAITLGSPNSFVSVGGLVDGGDKAGIILTPGAPQRVRCDPYAGAAPRPCNTTWVWIYPSASTTLEVVEGGLVTGAQAVTMSRNPDNMTGGIGLRVVNAGTMIGTAGPAIVGGVDNSAISISNLPTGWIGGMSGAIQQVINEGVIDGGSNAAIATSADAQINNRGRILSAGPAATIAAAGSLYLSNDAGATLGGGATAVATGGALTLINAGTIVGSIVSTAAAGQNSEIDTLEGTIDGDVLFGAGDDLLRARFDVVSGRIASITGRVDGGAGIDTLAIGIDRDWTLSGVALPASFERLGLDLSENAVVTIAPDFIGDTGIVLGGYGTLINEANLVTSGQAVVATTRLYPLTFINRGTVTATMAGADQTAVGGPSSLTNLGTITAIGGAGARAGTMLVNRGTISASGVAAAVGYGGFDNSGVIVSTGDVGAEISGQGGYPPSTNDGSITGATVGVQLSSSTLTNNGTIAGGTAGVALDSMAVLNNAATGTVIGGVRNDGGQARVINAGTIEGNVDLVSTRAFDFSDDLFVDAGGTVSGAINLGGGDDQLVVDLVTSPGRPFAGALGGVDGGEGNDTLRYRVNADASATIALGNGFEQLAYELDNQSALSLTATAPITTTIGLAGNGTVTLAGSISANDRTLIDMTIPTASQLSGGGAGPDRALSLINNGTLSLTLVEQNYSLLAGINAGDADVTNNGTIAIRNGGRSFYTIGIFAGSTVTNAGAITLAGGGTGIDGARDVINSGTILGEAGFEATGVSNFVNLFNSGTILVDGTAVQAGFSAPQITNSGTIESRQGTAVLLGYYDSVLVNEAGGTIRGPTAVDISSGALLVNRGNIVGTVSAYPYSSAGSGYIADGGTLAGDLLFGAGQDVFVTLGADSGVSGTIDGGDGIDIFGKVLTSSGTVTLEADARFVNFEGMMVQAAGADTVATIAAAAPSPYTLHLSGSGTVINTAAIEGSISAAFLYPINQHLPDSTGELAVLDNRGSVAGGVYGTIGTFINSGSIGSATSRSSGVFLDSSADLGFANSGLIENDGTVPAVMLLGTNGHAITATNSGTIAGGGGLFAAIRSDFGEQAPAIRSTIMLTNSGSIVGEGDNHAVRFEGVADNGAGLSLTLVNSGTIEATGEASTGVSLDTYDYSRPATATTIAVTNSGTIRANGGGREQTADYWNYYPPYLATEPANALTASGNAGSTFTVTNSATGLIEATGDRSSAIASHETALQLDNAGTIRGTAGTTLDAEDVMAGQIGSTRLAGAVQAYGGANDHIVNSGTIIGSIDLNRGNDRIENYGRIEGNVFLGLGDDTFLQSAGAVLIGTVDAGDGIDSFIVDATGGGAVNGDQFVNFERFSQIGEGNVSYSGDFRFGTIDLSGGTITVGAGQTLSSTGITTVTGSAGTETLRNDGTVAGAVDLAGGDDLIVNNGVIQGAVSLGDGNDQFVDGAGSSVGGTIDGGAGDDRYVFMLAGDRTATQAGIGFERLAVQGSAANGGTLTLASNQDWTAITLSNAGLDLTLGGHSVGTVTGSEGSERFTVDGAVGTVALGGGDDMLTLGGPRVTGLYLGEAGTDSLRFTATGPVVLTGTVQGFEQIVLDGRALTVAGTLGAAGDGIGFGGGDQVLDVVAGGTLAGTIDLGAGNDSFTLSALATLNGTVSGGAGTDSATLRLSGNHMLGSGVLRDFETLQAEGPGELSLGGVHGYDRVAVENDLAVLAGATLAAGQVQLGAGDNRFTIAGRFAGSVDGGAGNDMLAVSGGSAAAPVAFGNIARIEMLAMSGGHATLSGSAVLGGMDLTGGRFVGLAGSTIVAPNIVVRQGATFGSAGTVNGNLTVAGTLSPGASPGTMTVNGNVALAAGSVSLFELAPSVYDQLIVNGAVSIAPGATLQLAADQGLTPGGRIDLVVASGGITGSYTNIVKSADVFGIVIQQADRISLLAEFLNDGAFSPQAQRSIDYVNGLLRSSEVSAALLAAVPQLADRSGASNAAAFAQLTPEAYASAHQISVEHGLELADAGRGDGFAPRRTTPGPFTFASGLANHRTLKSGEDGTSRARTTGYGFIGGIGWGSTDWSIGAFVGYLDSRQTLAARAARTETDGVVGGVHGRWSGGAISVKATIAYDGSNATTRRTLPGGSAEGDYDLRGWTGDISVDYSVPLGTDWMVQPSLGLTAIRTTRSRVAESGGSAFALDVARRRDNAVFVDGALSFRGGVRPEATVRPYLSVGLRYQAEGRTPYALGALDGGPYGLLATGTARAPVLATAALGTDVLLSSRLVLFGAVSGEAGNADRRASARAGFRLAF